MAVPTGLCLGSTRQYPISEGGSAQDFSGVEREANALMKTLRNSVVRRVAGGAVAGLVLALSVAAGASADAYIDENGVPVAGSGGTTVSIVGGEAVILYGDDAASEIEALSNAAEANEMSLDDSSGLAVSDASGGEYNVGINSR
jgi:hypothetical protein